MSVNHWIYTLACAFAVAASQANANLIITGVFDGPLDGGEPKVVELYAQTAIANLGLYSAGSANNGGGTDGPENPLSGSAGAGQFIYIVDDNSDSATGVEFAQYFGFTPSLLFDSNLGLNGGAAAINGDDAVELFFDPTGTFSGGQTVVDTFGNIAQSGTGQPWEYLDGWAYRKSGTGPDGATFVIANWTFSGINATDGQTTNGAGPSVFPIGTYLVPEPATLTLAALGLFSVAILRRRD
jgi:hypothetical protein